MENIICCLDFIVVRFESIILKMLLEFEEVVLLWLNIRVDKCIGNIKVKLMRKCLLNKYYNFYKCVERNKVMWVMRDNFLKMLDCLIIYVYFKDLKKK